MNERTSVEVASAERRALLNDYWLTFTTESGQRVLADLRKSAFADRTTVERDRNGAIDPLATLRNEGARALLASIEAHVRDAKAGPPAATTYAVSTTATGTP